MMAEDKQNVPNVINLLLDENKQKQLLAEDEEENFLDECKFLVYFLVIFSFFYVMFYIYFFQFTF